MQAKPYTAIKWKWKCQDIHSLQMKIYNDSGNGHTQINLLMASFCMLLSLLPRSGLYFFSLKINL